MQRFTIRLLIALLTFFLGTTAAALLATSRPALVKEYDHAADLNAPRLETDTDIRQSDYLKAIEIVGHNQEYPVTARRLEDMSRDPVTVDLDLAESIEDQLIILHTYPGESWEFKVEQQFETSLTVMDEGPHIDLLDWKHYTSAWKEIRMIERNKFLTSKIGESEPLKFPQVTKKEILVAVKEAERKLYADYYETAKIAGDPVDEKWSKLARQCKSSQDYPCTVSVSKIRLRIKVKDGDQWKTIKQMEFNVPMGC
ncbi:MAG TPA: hypothetical protein VF708_18300 [Pyrinomonadaceae bacterium]|jgi:hypothetical protein